MYRSVIEQLKLWKASDNRKPMIINGLRQVGKTWMMTYFSENYFSDMIYINFDMDVKYVDIFKVSKNPDYILNELSLLFRKKIDPEKTLIIFDEIQACNEALNALKYFNEDQTAYFILCAGSYLGISLNQNQSFPVGQVEILDMHPMSFNEFLLAKKEEHLIEYIEKTTSISAVVHEEIMRLLFEYYRIGGMPEAVDTWLTNGSVTTLENVQDNILNAYYRDFGKYPPMQIVPKILSLWESIIPQLTKENKKFIYSHIGKGARAREYETSLEWLTSGRYLTKVTKVNSIEVPLKAYEKREHFKLYLPDVGLFRKKSEFPLELLRYDDKTSNQLKGAIAETYVLQELKYIYSDVFYWSNKNYEIDFLIQRGKSAWPIEVKFEENVKSSSLNWLLNKYPNMKAIRYSQKNLSYDGQIINIPLYMVSQTERLINELVKEE